jgi:thiol-disulfide isomerase/thioredoxin
MQSKQRWLALLLVHLFVAASSNVQKKTVVRLEPSAFSSITKDNGRWMIYFTVQGCKHCERLGPMMGAFAETLGRSTDLQVGVIDATKHNGIPRTFGVKRFPTILLLEGQMFFEFHGPRSIPRLAAFADGAPGARGGGYMVPTTFEDDASEMWLLAETLWEPFKIAITWSVGIALVLKMVSACLLRLLQGRERRLGGASAVAKRDD